MQHRCQPLSRRWRRCRRSSQECRCGDVPGQAHRGQQRPDLHPRSVEHDRRTGPASNAVARRARTWRIPAALSASGTIVGLEALLRWNHPERGLTSPCTFIPLAEETGIIVPIGEWVLRTACRQLALWEKMGLPPLAISINLSVRQLLQKGLVAMVAATLRDAGLAPGRLDLELTESLLARDTDAAIGVLRALRSLGVRLSIDDFGTGYSSLGYMKRLPISRLKIDQSFVRDIDSDPANAAIARSMITLGHSLNLEVLAEGVETQGERHWLRAAGCKLGQGYLFSRPVDASAVPGLLIGVAACAA
ncbi:MAG: EAL domain-containing protein [Betaproteobacteria bacterium]|nr:MAG: EAL domain-containing protein [Betaproteobacteria bacterium]